MPLAMHAKHPSVRFAPNEEEKKGRKKRKKKGKV
jgi:hypothetical protein